MREKARVPRGAGRRRVALRMPAATAVMLIVCAAAVGAAVPAATSAPMLESVPDAIADAAVPSPIQEEGDEPRLSGRGLLSPGEGESLQEWTARWMEGPVQTIATDEEVDLYENLDTTQERLEFIRLFWQRRDPTPRGPENEFLQEFERRVEYAEENFSDEGDPGWDTVFGRVVLAFGPPDRTRRELSGFPPGFSDRAPILWGYDERLPELDPNEELLFVFRNGRWNLLPPSVGPATSGVEARRRQQEADSFLTAEISSAYEQSMEVAKQDSLVNPVDYEQAIRQVETTVAFTEAQIPFGWEATTRPAEGGDVEVELELTWRTTDLIFHRVDEEFRTDMVVRARLRGTEGELVAEGREQVRFTADPERLSERSEETVSETVQVTAAPGRYTLELILEDQVLGYRTAYREELEIGR